MTIERDSMKRILQLHVNGETYEVLTEIHKTLLEVLREDLGLTGTKRGCDLGSCGACTVLIDGKPYLSCLTLAADAPGKEILTIEEAAAYLQIGKRSLYKLVKEGKIPGKKILNKWRFEKESLKEWIREGFQE